MSIKRWYLLALFMLVACIGCQWQMRPDGTGGQEDAVTIERFDQMEILYLTTGDFAALQQMKTSYPTETRALIEDVLRLGRVDEADINTRFLIFFQDSTLQSMMGDVEKQYRDVDDLNGQLTEAFRRLRSMLPDTEMPRIYTQIGSLDQSIVVGDGMLGISLDKYLGEDYPVYLRYGYSEGQRRMMTRQYIVPDCLCFYLLNRFPLPADSATVADSIALTRVRRSHMGRIQWVVNQLLDRPFFQRDEVTSTAEFMKAHPDTSVEQLLSHTF